MSVKSAKRVLDILELYARSREPATLTRIAEALEVPKSSCLALIGTLESNGYLYQVRPQLGYYPTRRWLDHAQVIVEHDPLVRRFEPAMSALRDETGETVILGRRAGDRVMYILVVESKQTVRYTARAGQQKPLYGTASGKALLATLPAEERRAVLKRLDLKAFTRRTITRRDALERDIERGLRRGWHFTVGEHVPDVVGIAATVRVNGESYVLVVAGPIHRLETRLEQTGGALARACRQLEGAPGARRTRGSGGA